MNLFESSHGINLMERLVIAVEKIAEALDSGLREGKENEISRTHSDD